MGIDVQVKEGVGWVVLNRPERRNAIDMEMRGQLREAIAELDASEDVTVIALIGTGTAFCAGADLKEEKGDSPHQLAAPRPRIAAPVESAAKVVLACINGAAMGGGLELALAADLRVAAASARLGLPEVRVGSVPASGGIQRLIRTVPAAIAHKMLYTGAPIDAAEALRVGLVSDVFADDDFMPACEELAGRLAAGAPLAMRAIKAAVRAGAQAPLDTALAFDQLAWGMVATTEDWREGRAAFREGREPRYRGR
jgi:enoyl-CoA hydratase/carnithine racemase